MNRGLAHPAWQIHSTTSTESSRSRSRASATTGLCAVHLSLRLADRTVGMEFPLPELVENGLALAELGRSPFWDRPSRALPNMFHSDGQRESSVIRKIYFWAIVLNPSPKLFSTAENALATVWNIAASVRAASRFNIPPLTKANSASRSSRGSSLVLLMIFSIKPANGPSNRWCGHTGATLSPSL